MISGEQVRFPSRPGDTRRVHASHPKHSFDKMEVRSQVELARLVARPPGTPMS
jgi:hypothetical protein